MSPPSDGARSGSDLPGFMRIEAIERLFELGRRSKPLWWYPTWSLAGGLLLGLLTTRFVGVDYGPFGFLIYEGDPESARSFVSLAASSVATVTSLTLTITVVTLQLASSQYSPRLIEHYLNDRGIRAVISLFMMTFAFSVATLLSVRLPGDADDAVGEVPGVAVSLLVVLIVGCLGALVFFVFRVTQSIRVESILKLVRDRTIEAIGARGDGDASDELDRLPEPPADGRLIRARRTGFFVDIDREKIDDDEIDAEIDVWILVPAGEFVSRDKPVAVVAGWPDDRDDDELDDLVASWLQFAAERWIESDYSYGVRSLTDVALKALSPGINDPTTAVMALNRIGEVMAAAATSHPRRMIELERGGHVYIATKTWGQTLQQVLHQLALYGRDDVLVVTAVIEMLWSLLWLDIDDDRREEIAEAGRMFEELVDVDRPDPDRRVIERHFQQLRDSFDDEPVWQFRHETDRIIDDE